MMIEDDVFRCPDCNGALHMVKETWRGKDWDGLRVSGYWKCEKCKKEFLADVPASWVD